MAKNNNLSLLPSRYPDIMRHWNFEVDPRANGFVVAGDQYARDKR